MVIELVCTPGVTDGDEVLPALRTWFVKSNVTEKLKLAPALRAPVGKLELEAEYSAEPRTIPLSEVMAMFAVQVTFKTLVFPIGTEPKSTGEVQVKGNATGDP